ncbi:hypothetical protein GX51_03242 [Blastomyces parvus]|uniref:WSC domain-containing protein n=1 Tax=Blastomyces parvus TaxID=2060905 RepID=A0A2B7X833_9EURO|nr:hypothetical protein GX51_03242 [Blastomyces parvus]
MAVLSGFFVPYILVFLYVIPGALSVDLCSSTNTGSSFNSVLDIYQSSGACTKTCSKYAVAILQGKSCWCSNDVPGGTIGNSACDEPCPGYPDDMCGNSAEGLYAYVLLKKPSRTIGPVTKTPVSATSQTGITTVTETQHSTTTASSTQTPTSTSTSSTRMSKPTDPGPNVTSTGPPGQGEPTSGSSISGGAIAGIVVGTLLGVGLIVSAVLWLFFIRRRREQENEKIDTNGYDRSPPPPSFHTSVNRPAMTYQRSPHVNGPTGMHDPNLLGVPGFTDSRMKNDAAIYPNGNRHSNVSLQDNQDYSRPVLRLTNPD